MTSHAEELARDAAARRAAQTEFDAPLIVEAGAGTGKTTTLVSRILIWSLGRGWEEARDALEQGESTGPEVAADPDRIAARVLERITAITFTEAAAAEMAGRAARDLAAISSGRRDDLPGIDLDLLPEEPEAGLRARALLGVLDRLNVRTIHAFCRALLARHPLEAGLHPDLEVDPDGSRVEEIVRELVEARSREAYAAAGSHPLLELATLGHGPRSIADSLRELAVRAFPPATLARSPFDVAGVAAMEQRLRERLQALQAAEDGRLATVTGANVKAPQVARQVAASLELLAQPAGTDPLRRADALVRALRRLWSERAVESWLRDWSRGKFSGGEQSALGERMAALGVAAGELRAVLRHYLKLDPVLLETARRCLASLLAEAAAALRSRGVITFDALLRETRDLLAGDTDVLADEQGRIRQLLVDEFQDTDGIQCEIVRLLALADGRERGLFLVGDPKQTIFGWRNADLEAYEDLAAAALAAGGRRVSLLRNFRSVPPLLDEVNRAIGPIMEECAGLQPRYEPLVPSEASDALSGSEPAVEYWLSWPAEDGVARPPTSHTEAAELEARAVAEDIAARYQETGRWGAFAILFRATTWQETYLEALRARGVPFRVTRDKNYYRRREIIDAAALARVVVHPADQIALVTWLRSPTVGVPDAAWIPLWRHRFPDAMVRLEAPSSRRLEHLRRLVAAASSELPPHIAGLDAIVGWQENLIDALEAIAELRRVWREEPVDVAIRRLRDRVLVDCTESARFLGAYRSANLDRFFRRLRDALDETGGDSQAVLRAIRRGVTEAWEAEEAMPQEAASEAVQVSTIHAAKGLEFDHVYLVQTHGWSPGERSKPVDLDERQGAAGPAEYAILGVSTPGFDRVLARREAIAAAERVRTLYVALTRAKRRLVVAGSWPSRIDPKPAQHASTHVDLLVHRWPQAEGLPQSRLAKSALVDDQGALWRLTPAAATASLAQTGEGLGARLPGLATIREEAERLRDERRSAARRMRLSRTATASSESGERLARRAEAQDPTDTAEEALDGSTTPGAREAALAVGETVHRLLEDWDLAADPRAELSAGRERAIARLGSLPAGPRDLAVRRVSELLDRFARGTLLRRFTALEGRVLGREVPLLLAAQPGLPARSAPLGAWSGALDLLYRNESGRPVVVDYKTDAVEDAEVVQRARAYALQEAVYREAVRRAFSLAELPEFELWFLWPDRLWTVS